MQHNNSFEIKKGDTRPTLKYQLRRDGSPIDIRAAESVSFRVEQASSQALYIDSVASIEDPANGIVSYTLTPDDTLPVNTYHAEFEIQWDTEGTAIQRVPERGYIEIDVHRPIGGDLDATDITDPDVTVTTISTDNLEANTGDTISLHDDIDGGDSAALENLQSVSTGQFDIDYSESYPKYPNQPIASSSPSITPHPAASNPVLTPAEFESATGTANVRFIADPFIAYEDGLFHLYFEVAHDTDGDGTESYDIGHAQSSDAINWTPTGMTTIADGHDAYPYIFKNDGNWYITPDNGHDYAFELWQLDAQNLADDPHSWTKIDTPLNDSRQYTDPTVVKWDDVWYMWAYENSSATDNQTILMYADDLFGEWSEHPQSPVTSVDRTQRPGGRPIVREDAIDIWYMDSREGYGDIMRAYRVTDLSKDTYSQTELASSPVMMGEDNGSWNSRAMHHIDFVTPRNGGTPIVVTDGTTDDGVYSIGIFTITRNPTDSVRLGTGVARGAIQDIPSTGGTDDGRAIYPWSQIELDTIAHNTKRVADETAHTVTVPESGYYIVEGTVGYHIGAGVTPDTGVNHFRISSRIHNRTAGSELVNDDTSLTIESTRSNALREGSTMMSTTYLEEGAELAIDSYQNSGSDTGVTVIFNGGHTHLSIQRVR